MTLRRMARLRADVDQCEFCNLPLSPAHRHVLEVPTRKIVCACDPCALRFDNVVGRWKLIPRDTRPLPDFKMTDADWEALSIPINLAFFFYSTQANKIVAMYPSPTGATESLLPLASWKSLMTANPWLAQLEPDVEALLVKRLGDEREYYLAPIDSCFELVGMIRIHWRGFTGGDKVWLEIEKFFAKLKPSVSPLSTDAEAVHA